MLLVPPPINDPVAEVQVVFDKPPATVDKHPEAVLPLPPNTAE